MSNSPPDFMRDFFNMPAAGSESRFRDGANAGFKLCQKHVASMLRREGYPEMAKRVEAMELSKKAGTP